jgi:hypothetical protein
MPIKDQDYVNTYCVPESIMCALLWGEKTGEPVGIEVSQINENENHFQAFAIHRGEKTYLTADWLPKEGLICRPHTRHFPDSKFLKDMSIPDVITEQQDVLKAFKPEGMAK